MSYEFISTEQKGRVGVITLNRPKQLNALSPGLMKELGQALLAFDADAGVEHFGRHASFTATCLMRVYSSIE